MLALPIFPGRPTYCHAVRNSPVDCSRRKKAPTFQSRLVCWHYLPSRVGQVLSCRRKCPVDTCRQKKNPQPKLWVLCWRYLASRVGQRIVTPSGTVRWTLAGKKEPSAEAVGFMLALPDSPGSPTYCRVVRDSPVDCYWRKKAPIFRSRLLCWRYGSSWVGQVLSWRRKCPVDTFRQNH